MLITHCLKRFDWLHETLHETLHDSLQPASWMMLHTPLQRRHHCSMHNGAILTISLPPEVDIIDTSDPHGGACNCARGFTTLNP